MGYRDALPQLDDAIFLTDSGLETTLVFEHRIDLPLFASFPLLASARGEQTLREYFAAHAAIATRNGLGTVLDTATWRASHDWGAQLGFDDGDLARLNRRAVALLEEIRRDHESSPHSPVVINGVIGPRGDGYVAGESMSAREAERYHFAQVATLGDTAADLVTAVTMTSAAEAIGVARAAQRVGMPVAISFTVETDGVLPSGETLGQAIHLVDAATDGYPSYFLLNCAHPTHFSSTLATDDGWVRRLRGVRSNGSRLSHAELDVADELHSEAPDDLAHEIIALRQRNPQLTILGGCCGTTDRHIDALAIACRS